MAQRTLTITMQPDWRMALRAAGRAALADRYQGETLNFETPSEFFGRLTERRWVLIQTLLGAGELSVRELARRLERSDSGGVLCPFEDIQIDLRLRSAA